MTRPFKVKPTPQISYLSAVIISVGVATGLTLMLRHYFDNATPAFLCYFAAVSICSGLGGLWPGVGATLLSAVAVELFIFNPGTADPAGSRSHMIQIGLFVIVSFVISGLSERLQVGMRRAEVARDEAERARRRIGFLADASAALDMSLDYRANLTALAHKAVPAIADWCAIDLIGADQSISCVAAAHREPDTEELIRQLRCRYPLDPSGLHPIQKAMKTGRSDIYLDVPDSALVAAARDQEHLKALRALQIRSYLCVPLQGREGVQGTLLFVHSSRNRYNEADRALAEDIAHRAALALDNARLYREAQDELAERKRAEEALERSREETEALNTRLQRSMIETHHRVKNNLQIITAMIDMRLMDGDAEIPAEEIERIGSYIKTLAAVHDLLTLQAREQGEPKQVSARAIIEKLLALMQATAADRKIIPSLEDADLPAKQVTSLALVVNEIVSNGLKYGKGDIEVSLVVRNGPASSGPVLELTVLDDGPGFGPDFDPVCDSNTGLELIDNLARWDLGGSACYENRPEGGASVRIVMPLPAAPASQDTA